LILSLENDFSAIIGQKKFDEDMRFLTRGCRVTIRCSL